MGSLARKPLLRQVQSAAGVRPLEPEDLPAVAALFQRTMAPRSSADGVETLFRSVLLDDPWADPRLPSLVATDADGALLGMLLASPRRLRLDGKPLRGMCGMHVLVDPAARGGGAAFDLLMRFLRGAQDVSFTDGAPEDIRPLLARLDCHPLQLESLEWTSILRPAAYWRGRLHSGRGGGVASHWPVAPFDELLARSPLTPSTVTDGLSDEPLTPGLMVAHLDALTSWARLRPDYDLPFLTWLFAQLGNDHPQGELAARLVRRDGQPIGWHISLVRPGGMAETMQLVARPRDTADVFAALLSHARERGAAAVRGRLEAALLDAITTRRTLLRRTSFVMLRARDPDVLGAITSGAAVFTRLDADWWVDPRGR